MSSEIKQGLFKLDLIDYHAILGVPIDADAREIRLRYLKIVPKLHPDTCKANSKADKELANGVLARLVNPAYENLNREKIKAEHMLLLSQKARGVAKEGIRITLMTEKARALAKAGGQLETIYRKLILALAMDQYRDLDAVIDKIGQISEINLVYLIFKETQKRQVKRQQFIPEAGKLVSSNSAKETQYSASKDESGDLSQGQRISIPPLDACVKRAQEYRINQKYKDAILELRDALQIDPQSGSCHALLGLVYIEQNSLSLAKVHIEKAWQTNPKDPIVIEAKEALSKQNQAKTLQQKSATPKPGMFSNLFGKKK
ncbi:J domain-containing protein [Gloeocapsa sp. PCC 73106]|uniref:J domain-containing protein n=1 Tax=Gloeocapsa sp. PCC 73106 TaxID=102232 RepID=UPI0002ACAE29|nr:J domain-containing protein [Gloeocapsa sp. PCC 73106]ELR98418.1 DnaJ-class molecular chaperone with C-terminal Zn finger domain [Gloeocapsa sp. PCC 73106]